MTRRELILEARRLGYVVEPTANGHLRFRHPGGATVIAASTPSDWRSTHNTLAALRRETRRHITARTSR
jgi:hypothetical protein